MGMKTAIKQNCRKPIPSPPHPTMPSVCATMKGFVYSIDHELGELIMDTGNVELYPCLRCGLVVWVPRGR